MQHSNKEEFSLVVRGGHNGSVSGQDNYQGSGRSSFDIEWADQPHLKHVFKVFRPYYEIFPENPGQIFECSMYTFIKVNYIRTIVRYLKDWVDIPNWWRKTTVIRLWLWRACISHILVLPYLHETPDHFPYFSSYPSHKTMTRGQPRKCFINEGVQ